MKHKIWDINFKAEIWDIKHQLSRAAVFQGSKEHNTWGCSLDRGSFTWWKLQSIISQSSLHVIVISYRHLLKNTTPIPISLPSWWQAWSQFQPWLNVSSRLTSILLSVMTEVINILMTQLILMIGLKWQWFCFQWWWRYTWFSNKTTLVATN